jgi:hypothetical protein
MTQDDFDDGLVHDHGWACRERGRMVHRPPVEAMPAGTMREDRYDDGLVHEHRWACGERGRMAQG